MCQIIFSPGGDLCSKADFWEANNDNNDGIGVMHAAGVQKFFGKRQVKRAWAYVQTLSDNGFAWAAHFRYGTAGLRDRTNVHPFTAPNGVLWMHNGVMRQAELYDKSNERSDTALFVDLLGGINNPAQCVDLLEMMIGQGNKLLAYAPALDQWTIFNEHLGEWDAGCWFSNEYSRANWQSKYGTTRYASKLSGYLYDYDQSELTELNSDGSRGKVTPITPEAMEQVRRGYAGGTTSDGKQIIVLDRTDAESVTGYCAIGSGDTLNGKPYTRTQLASVDAIARTAAADYREQMALTQRSAAVEQCKTCTRLELKRCYCTNGPNSGQDLDIALDVLDRRNTGEVGASADMYDLDEGRQVSLTDPALIQERIDSYLAEDEAQRERVALDAGG